MGITSKTEKVADVRPAKRVTLTLDDGREIVAFFRKRRGRFQLVFPDGSVRKISLTTAPSSA